MPNSIIEAQIEFEEQVKLELERCLDIGYFYANYLTINKSRMTEAEIHLYDVMILLMVYKLKNQIINHI